MINGTSVMTGVAAHCVHDARTLAAIALTTHALYIQALRGTNQSFHPFIHHHKPHRGQILAARLMLELIEGSRHDPRRARRPPRGSRRRADPGPLLAALPAAVHRPDRRRARPDRRARSRSR